MIAVRMATPDDAPAVRRLVNDAYRELGEMGLNFTGVTQDEETTRRRMADRDVYLLYDGADLIATVSAAWRADREPPHAYVNQLAVRPDRRREGLGSLLMALAERDAAARGLSRVRLDTAIPARHLLEWYARRGYRAIGERQWEGKTYRSVILEKVLTPAPA